MKNGQYIPIFEPYLEFNEKKYLLNCLKTNWISSQGIYIKKFENKIAKLHKAKYCVATSSCTTALHLALVSLDIGKGDEVICPALSFISPANMIALTGAKLVLVDVESENLNINTDLIEKKINKKTKAILFVNQFGNQANIDSLKKISKKYNLKLIEDNAESFMGEYNNKKLGTFSDIGVFSFFANKIITTGEGGALITNNKKIYNKLIILRDHGMSKKRKYFHTCLGFNYRMTNMQAAIGCSQLENIDKILRKRRRIFNYYYVNLIEFKEIQILTNKMITNKKNANWLFTIVFKTKQIRNMALKYLKLKNIETRPMIRPINEALHFKNQFKTDQFPIAKSFSDKSLHLPSSTGLSTTQQKRIISNLKDYLNSN